MKRLLMLIPLLLIAAPVMAEAPKSQILGPASTQYFYNQTAWNAQNPINGNASDDVSVQTVYIKIINTTTGNYWDGSGWTGLDPLLTATLTNPGAAQTDWYWPSAGIYTPSPGEIEIRSYADDGIEQEDPEQTVTVFFDNVWPDITISPPAYTNKTYITVSWISTDNESGIERVEVEWNASDQPWKNFPTSKEPKSSHTLGGVNETWYLFRATAWDYAENSGLSGQKKTIVDWTPPASVMNTLPEYSTSSLFISWNVVEAGSGIQLLDVEYNYNNGGWQDIGTGSLFCTPIGPTSTSTTCTATDGFYEFRMMSIDNAGNPGEYSNTINTTVDEGNPINCKINSPETIFINQKTFNLSWQAEDPGSGIQCYHVQWRNDTTWKNIINTSGGLCLPFTEVKFGKGMKGDPSSTHDDETFWFQMNASDAIGNECPWVEMNTTIDTINPEITLTVLDQNDNPVVSPGGPHITQLKITSDADDNISGITNHMVYVKKIKDNTFLENTVCNTDKLCKNTTGTDNADTIEVWSEVFDKAGNSNTSYVLTITSHPLANFGTEEAHLSLGGAHDIDMFVRNLDTQPINITVNLLDYKAAGFTAGIGDFENYSISNKGRELNITNLIPGGRGTFKVQIIAADMDFIPILNMTAFAGALSDTDSLEIHIGFPASFDALSEGWLSLLIVTAALGYFFTTRKKTK
jgi:hypothetical protein